ncbi:MAG: thiamine diphosphokinase [Actinomycetota bacterium]
MEAASTDPKTAAVFAGGKMSATVTVDPSSLVIAADSGYDNARSRGVAVDLLVGDLDSISEDGLTEAAELGVTIERYPVDKDATDLEIAIDAARLLGATEITVYAGESGTFSHLLGVALGLTGQRWEGTHIVWKIGGAAVYRSLPSSPVTLVAEVGSIVTVLPIGDATGVTTAGLQWPLQDADLLRGTTRGISNIATDPVVSISLDTGALIIIIEEKETT